MARPLPPPSAEPFVIHAHKKPRAWALCIHGYTGSPFEMMPLAHALRDVDVSSVGIVLPGHEGGASGDPKALNKTSWRDWVRAGAAAFHALPKDQPRILAGSSMGALVALSIAAESQDDVAALVLLAPALRFFRDGQIAAAASARGLWRALPYLKKTKGSDVADDDGRAQNPCMPFLPLRGVAQLAAMQTAVERDLSSVRAPVCILHGAQDHTIPPLASEIVARKVGSARVEHHVLRDSFHVVGIDVDRDQVCALATSFVHEALLAEAVLAGEGAAA